MRTWTSPEVPALQPADPAPVRLHDSASGRLLPVGSNDRARMYVCGITPYDATHLGHAATYLAFDLLNRAWRDAGFAVTFVQNVTDIDDPLLERAAQTGADWVALAERETELFRADMAALRVIPPDHYDSAVEAIPDAVALIRSLPQSSTYSISEDLYFTSSEVGQVCGFDEQHMRELFAQRGGDPTLAGKRTPLDSLLWKSAVPHEPFWQSELGPGRPGWHIECVAIAMRYFDLPFDVQGGGSDLVFPHHDMCNAIALAATGHTLARVFAHAGMIGYEGEKMSKSRGNLVLVSALRQRGVDMSALRLALLNSHYRSDREWHDGLLSQAQERLARWRAGR
ncbi:MAG: cysteine--1-D-myo-inosityl 2-amino-2-deoxy-alpha-D-glucopyranoside ligase, partial [Actinobacteria bacterium]|nr:cysteine--1-D-myo-inosityl 2-amino-2-deoxy-alpha-D-glucopyranoside ligase [Actinomycetota bacterium]